MENTMKFVIRSLSPQESRIVLTLTEQGRREIARPEIVELLGVSSKAADHVINSLRRKGWLERASWGRYLFIEPNQGPEALGESNLLALASRIAEPYYIGFGTAATHYGLTTQHRVSLPTIL
jgi:predicted transcriptional regulator of viral defense system